MGILQLLEMKYLQVLCKVHIFKNLKDEPLVTLDKIVSKRIGKWSDLNLVKVETYQEAQISSHSLVQ